ncbi:MAG: HAMP domain-containing histidine kinase [Acidobacteria bacterium]|nr:HAMP domain-containing histidine kinase [Acidobacteriota bacterium]
MRPVWFAVQCALAAATLCLVAVEYRALEKLEAAARRERAGYELRPVFLERVFAFPEVTCAPRPAPVAVVRRAGTPASVTRLAREQFQYGLLLSGCVLLGLILSAGLTFRAAVQQTRLAQLKSAFVSSVSHEMKTPLALIRMHAETLELGRVRDPARVSQYYRVIGRETRKLERMIGDLLDFARIECGRRPYRFAEREPGTLIKEVAEPYAERVASQGGSLNVDVERELPAIRMDEDALRKALENLLENAIRYSGEVMSIHVHARHEEEHLLITVRDRGIGIAEQDQKRIFEKFYRAATGRPGTGLGLAIAKEIVEAHGGAIEVKSRLGEGSAFTILLPARAGAGDGR